MANIFIGTCSWTDKSLIETKRFYPKGCSSAEERLRYYASQFPFVEVDSSYYAMPNERNSQRWAERTPPGFIFDVKAFRALTQHQTPRQALPPDLAAALPGHGSTNVYLKDLLLRSAASSGFASCRPCSCWRSRASWARCIFSSRRGSTRAVKISSTWRRFATNCPASPVAIEFRHESWFDDERRDATLRFERDHEFVNVVVDEPQGFKESIPAIWEVTSPRLAIVRLHGRNQAAWMKKGLTASSDRFNYDYSDDEIAELAVPIRSIAAKVASLHVPLNINYEDQGIRAGRALFRHLGDAAVQPRVEPFALGS